MLGVLVADPATPRSDLTDKLAKYVSQWGADPIWRSGSIAAPSPPVPAFSQRIMGGPIPEDRSPEFVPEEERDLPAPFPSVTNLIVPESQGTRVNVVPHGVIFDAKRNLYYADIVVKPGSSYFPFIRLALARFHPVSSPGAHLSPAVMVNWMQLTPDRLLVMTKGSGSNQRKLQLFGHIYSRSAIQEEPGGAIPGPVIQVEIQVRDSSKRDELDWQRFDRTLPAPIELFMATLDPEIAPKLVAEANDVLRAATPTLEPDLKIFAALRPPLMWERTITLPRRRAGEEFRVMVCEYEKHAVDTDRSKRSESAPDPALRLVYAETLAL
ncbi:MAG: hypothetical protein IH612_18230 [Desulfofustis sp.]|nr:hypothetical protein [Desulfofustis sp.]